MHKNICIFGGDTIKLAFRLTLIVFFCSPDMPESEATFAITGGGIADAKE